MDLKGFFDMEKSFVYTLLEPSEVMEQGPLFRIIISWPDGRMVTNRFSCSGGPILPYITQAAHGFEWPLSETYIFLVVAL